MNKPEMFTITEVEVKDLKQGDVIVLPKQEPTEVIDLAPNHTDRFVFEVKQGVERFVVTGVEHKMTDNFQKVLITKKAVINGQESIELVEANVKVAVAINIGEETVEEAGVERFVVTGVEHKMKTTKKAING